MLDLQNFNFEVKPIIIDKFKFLYLDRLSFPGMFYHQCSEGNTKQKSVPSMTNITSETTNQDFHLFASVHGFECKFNVK
jgi:hypothetical protein